jgi:hypothetical protein
MNRDRCSSPALSSVDGSDDETVELHGPLGQQIPLSTISALRATLRDDDRKSESPVRQLVGYLDDDDDEDFPQGNVTRHGEGGFATATLEEIWSKPADAQPRTPPDSVGETAVEQVIQAFERDDPNTPPFMVAVQALDPRTTTRVLFETFFPLGCSRAIVFGHDEDVQAIMHAAALCVVHCQHNDEANINPLPVPYPILNRRRIAGLVFFKSEDTARFAAFKMHDFVPHGQSSPLHVCFASGKLFAKCFREYTADTDTCLIRFAASQPGLSGLGSNPPSHNTSLNASEAGQSPTQSSFGPPRRIAICAQQLFHTLRTPLTAMTREAARLALAIAEVDASAHATTSAFIAASDRAVEMILRDDHSADEAVQLLCCGINANHRGLLRLLDLLCRNLASTMADADTALLVGSRFQVPLCKRALSGILFGNDRAIRLGSAALMATLLDVGFISGSPFSVCIRLFDQRVLSVPSSFHRDAVAEAIIALAACVKNCSAQKKRGPVPFIDVLAGGVVFPNHRDDRPEGQERDFMAIVARFKEEGAAEAPRTPTQVALSAPGHTPSKFPWTRESDLIQTPDPEASVSSNDDMPVFAVASQQPPIPRHAVSSTGSVVGLPPPRMSEPTTQQPPSTLNADILPCTVYVTRIPRALSDSKLRAILFHYGDVTKVRVYDSTSKRSVSGERDDSAFCFVEYRTPTGARNLATILDRAQLHLIGTSWESAVWHVTALGTAPAFTDDTHVLAAAVLRCSPARSAIHDHDPRDAVYDARGKLRECLFGVLPRAAGASLNSSVSSLNGPLSFTTRPMPKQASTVSTPSKAGLNISAMPWTGPSVAADPVEGERANRSTLDSSHGSSGFIVTGNPL